MRNYTREGSIFVSSDSNLPFKYSDGDDTENYILSLITNASDIFTGSEELFSGIRDWPTLYHLTPKRINLLKPLEPVLKEKTVLEIGSGCGAITRYLGELNCRVTALEGSYRRARITRERCRDLGQVEVICDNFQHFEIPDKFDIVTLIGVLEYSNIFIEGGNPSEEMLKKVRGFLKPGGCLILAIENKLGLKYLAGAPEDHVGKPYFGVEDRYNKHTPVTFGRNELHELLTTTGFVHQEFLYPFPDYKLPDVVIPETGFSYPGFKVEDLLLEKYDYFQNTPYRTHFSTTLSAESLQKDKQLFNFANSFLVIASPTSGAPETDKSVLAYSFNTLRKRSYCRESVFRVGGNEKEIEVLRKNIYPGVATNTHPSYFTPYLHEKYIAGKALFKDLVQMVSREGWTLEEPVKWAGRYYGILSGLSHLVNGRLFLRGKYLGLHPSNIMVLPDDSVRFVDLEWNAREDIPLLYLFWRGIRDSLSKIILYGRPDIQVPPTFGELTFELIRAVMPFGPLEKRLCEELENKFFGNIMLKTGLGDDKISLYFRE
jgi:precorrin-6B methylase 2